MYTQRIRKGYLFVCFVAENKGIKSNLKKCKMTGKTFVYFVTKIRIVFEPAIFSVNIFLKSIFFLINQIAKRGQKLTFPKQTLKNDRKKRTFSLPKDKN